MSGKFQTVLFPDAGHQDVDLWPRLVSVAWSVLKPGPCPPPTQYVLRPRGYEIPESATKIHGISHKDAEENGVGIGDISRSLLSLLESSHGKKNIICCYNAKFDRGVVLAEFLRQGQTDIYHALLACEWQCVMMQASKLLQWPRYKKLSVCAEEMNITVNQSALHTATGDVTLTILVMKALAKQIKKKQTEIQQK